MNKLFTISLFIDFFSCTKVETIKKPSVGNISVVTGNLQLSVLSSCLVNFDFGNLSEQVNLPSGGTIPADNINPGFYHIELEYDDYTCQLIYFNIFPGETTNISLKYGFGSAPYFPPVSKIQPINITTQEGMPEWANEFPPDDCLWGIGFNNDRYTVEKYAYVNIARQLSTKISARVVRDEKGLIVWEESLQEIENISRVASESEILYVSYDPNNKTFWVLAWLSKANAKNALGAVFNSEPFNAQEALRILDERLSKQNEAPLQVNEQ